MTGQHLNPGARANLDLPLDQRIASIRSPRWIDYPRAQVALAQLEDLAQYPRGHRVPGLLLIGDANNGKTSLIGRFNALNPPRGGSGVAAFVVQAPSAPNQAHFYDAVLDALSAPYQKSHSLGQKQGQALRLLETAAFRMFVIDDVHQVVAGRRLEHRQFLNLIKYLTNELLTPMIAVGTEDAARAFLASPEMASRFPRVVTLPRWGLGPDYLELLAGFERALPLRHASHLTDDGIASLILQRTDGTIGEIAGVLTAAAVHAATTGRESIDADALNAIPVRPATDGSGKHSPRKAKGDAAP